MPDTIPVIVDYLFVFIPDSVIRGCSWSEARRAAKYFDQFDYTAIDDWDRNGKWILINRNNGKRDKLECL